MRIPRVSVVIPAYNSADFIAATMASVLAQTFTDFELIVSDHSSTDSTWERLQAWADHPQVTLTRIPAGGGALANWAAVTALARGEFVKLVCGDDLLYPTILAEQVAAFAEHPAAVLVAAQRDILDGRGVPVVRARGLQGLHGLVPGGRAIRRTVRAGTNVFGEPGCVLFRRSALEAAGGWDDRSPFLIDQATCARVLLSGPMVAVRRSLAGFRVNVNQWSVELARSQADHACAFHHRMRAEHPEVLSAGDVRVGDVRATVMAWKRRATYLWLRRRMAAADGDAGSAGAPGGGAVGGSVGGVAGWPPEDPEHGAAAG